MKNILTASLCALALASAPFALSSTADARPMTAQDLATMKRVGGPTVSADGHWLVYQITDTDYEANSRSTGLWLMDLTAPDTPPRRIADMDDASEHSASFAGDGTRLYFLSGKTGTESLWFIDLPGTKPVQASDLAADIAGYALSPAGDKVAVWGDIADDCPTFGCENDGTGAEPGPGSGREYDRIFVRHWDTWETPGTHSRVFAYTLSDGIVSAAGAALGTGQIGDTPSKPFGGGEEIAWAADGSAVFFAQRTANAAEPHSTDLDLYRVSADGSEMQELTANNEATDTLPAPSPDGKWLAYAAMERPGYESDRLVVMLRDLASGETRALTQDWDRSVGSIAWAPDGQSLLVTAGEVLDHPAFRVDIASGEVTRLTQTGNAGSVVPLGDGSILYTKNSALEPTDLFWMSAGRDETRLTNANADVLAQLDPVEYERFSFTGANGDTVWGHVIKPTVDAEKLPLAFYVHGGPQGSFSDSWSTRWNYRIAASQGYAVVSIDFHGSTGYGQAFTDSINRDWGGKPLEDLKLGYAALPEIDGQIDTENACALGASYGGYMMNWIQGNWPDRFKCIVNHDGLFDTRSFYYTTEELWFPEWDFGGPYYEAAANYEKWNPVQYVGKWKTPMLVVQGEKDFRVPPGQSLGAFNALQRRGIPSKLLVFPDENHWVLKARNSVQWHNNVFAWLERWLKDGGE